MDELLQYMILVLEDDAKQAEDERREVWYHHLSRIYAQPAGEKEPHGLKQGRKAFIEAFSDKDPKDVTDTNRSPQPKTTPAYEWDFDLLERLKQKQDAKKQRKGGA